MTHATVWRDSPPLYNRVVSSPRSIVRERNRVEPDWDEWVSGHAAFVRKRFAMLRAQQESPQSSPLPPNPTRSRRMTSPLAGFGCSTANRNTAGSPMPRSTGRSRTEHSSPTAAQPGCSSPRPSFSITSWRASAASPPAATAAFSCGARSNQKALFTAVTNSTSATTIPPASTPAASSDWRNPQKP